MRQQPDPPVWVFDNFSAGQQLGTVEITLDSVRLANWAAIFGSPGMSDRVPSGMLVAAMMEAYLKAIQPRPPGNVHAGQKLTFFKPVRVGESLVAEVSCLWKERRKDRGWVGFGVSLSRGGSRVLEGEIRTIWAR